MAERAGTQVDYELSEFHRHVLSHVATTMFPLDNEQLPRPRSAQIGDYFAKWLGEIPPMMSIALKMFFIIIQISPFLFIFRFSRFTKLSLPDKVKYLEAWENSWFFWCRMASQLIKSSIAMAYFADPIVRQAFGVPPIPVGDTDFFALRGQED